ncbi:hypothetical protein QZH41_019346, partial [Actinostola sp. cb2023]
IGFSCLKYTKMFIFTAFFVLVSYIKETHASCPAAFAQESFVLRNHVIQEIPSQTKDYCEQKCASHIDCQSINYYPGQHKCELNRASHSSNPVDLSYDVNGVYVENDKRPKNICSDSYCSADQICLIKDDGKNYHCKACASPLGMQSNAIPNSAITASSSLSNGHISWRARLRNYPAMPFQSSIDSAAWLPASNNVGDYLQIDIGRVVNVTKVATQGRPYHQANQYVKKYRLAYKRTDTQWMDYREANTVKVFIGNSDQATVVTNQLKEKIWTQFVKFIVVEWSNYIVMRVEIYGC